ncbi:MAG: clostripain-related cysteine peptidase [Candidatus Omnitrophota bacterium]
MDPVWGGHGLSFNSKVAQNNPRTEIDGITQLTADHRGILFNENSRTYMNNQQLVEALRQIKTNVLNNKKIDILGMDACLMAMVEVGYQAREYANYMVASQEVELAYGWDYFTIMQGLSSMGNITPAQLTKGIVLAYQNYYKDKIRFYTQSAISLENMGHIKDSIDQIVCKIDSCKKHDRNGIKEAVKMARKQAVQFSTRSYIDLHSFYSSLHKVLEDQYKTIEVKDLTNLDKRPKTKLDKDKQQSNSAKKVKNNQPFLKEVGELRESLQLAMKIIENSVVANTTGSNFTAAKGLSIYFPYGRIDTSYVKTDFAKDSLWLQFLADNL